MRIQAIIARIFRQFVHDRRTVALMFAVPLLVLTLMSLVFNGETYTPKIASVNLQPSISAALSAAGAEVVEMAVSEADEAIVEGSIDAILKLDGNQPHLMLEGSDPSKNKAVLLLFGTLSTANHTAPSGPTPVVTYLHGSADMVPFDSFGPVLIGVFAFFFVFLIAGIAFLRERTGGTLERLMVTPLRRYEIVIGYMAGFGIFTLIQACLIAWFAVDILDMRMAGSFGYVLLVTSLLALTALSLGILLSTFAANEFQMIQFIPIVIVPQVFFCGLFPLETMHEWLRWLSFAMPLTYGAEALREIMVKGGTWPDIAVNMYVLLGFTVAFMTANVIALKQHRSV